MDRELLHLDAKHAARLLHRMRGRAAPFSTPATPSAMVEGMADIHRWICECGAAGPWEADNGDAVAGGLGHGYEAEHNGRVRVEPSTSVTTSPMATIEHDKTFPRTQSEGMDNLGILPAPADPRIGKVCIACGWTVGELEGAAMPCPHDPSLLEFPALVDVSRPIPPVALEDKRPPEPEDTKLWRLYAKAFGFPLGDPPAPYRDPALEYRWVDGELVPISPDEVA